MILLSSESCAPCTIVKAYAIKHGLKVKEVDANQLEGKKLLMKHGVRGVPALIIDDQVVLGVKAIKEEFDALARE